VVFRLDQPKLLVLGLTPLTPFRRHIDTFLLLTITLLLILMHRCWFVLGRRVYCVQNERRRARIDELMLSAGGNDDQITSLDVLVDAVDRRFALSRRECQDLVDGVFLRDGQSKNNNTACKGGEVIARFKRAGTYLVTNLSIYRHCHEHQLAVQARPEDAAKLARFAG